MYTPKNLDVAAYSEYLKSCAAHQKDQSRLEIARAEAYQNGFEAGIREALQGVQCSNFERKLDPDSYAQGVNDLLYELGKELGCGSGGLREADLSLDEKAARMAELIRELFDPSGGAEDQ